MHFITMIKTIGNDKIMPMRIIVVTLAVLTLWPMFICGYFKNTDYEQEF